MITSVMLGVALVVDGSLRDNEPFHGCAKRAPVKTSFGRAERVSNARTLDDPVSEHMTAEERESCRGSVSTRSI